jgi:hypothetical protein
MVSPAHDDLDAAPMNLLRVAKHVRPLGFGNPSWQASRAERAHTPPPPGFFLFIFYTPTPPQPARA